jgi:hypothetical protein
MRSPASAVRNAKTREINNSKTFFLSVKITNLASDMPMRMKKGLDILYALKCIPNR